MNDTDNNSTNTSTSQRTTALISGLYLALVIVLAAVIMLGNPPAQKAVAQGSCGADVCQNETATFTINLVALDATVVSLNSSKAEVEINEPFALTWETSNAETVTAAGDWSGSLSADGTRTGMREASPGTYTYTVRAYNAEGDLGDTASVNVDVIQKPRYTLSLGASSVAIDGEPGSTASIPVTITSENGYSGSVDLSVINVPASLRDDAGNSIIEFSFGNNPIDTAGNTTLNMTVLQPIRTDISPIITVESDDLSNTAEDDIQTRTFELNADGFSPRTIEEF